MTGNDFTIVTGLYRSASTWIFNAYQEIFRLQDVDILHFYSDRLTNDVRGVGGRNAGGLIKTHLPDDELMAFVSAADHAIVLTIRHPLDCVASCMSQFATPFERALEMVAASADRTLAWNDGFQLSLFRYEDFFFDRISTIANLSRLVGLECTIGESIKIFGGLRRQAVRAKIDGLIAGGILDASRPLESFDIRSHWHPNHVGDGRIGKYRSQLSAGQIDQVLRRNERFHTTFYGEDARSAPGPRAASPRVAAQG